MSSDPYVYPNTHVLINKFNTIDQEVLSKLERQASYRRLDQLFDKPIEGDFDLKHMQAIHKHIFQDVYDWAGKIRTGYLEKGGTMFCYPQNIESYAGDVFKRLRKENYLKGLDSGKFSSRLAEYMADINALHLFREGNGRTQREFVRELALNAGYILELSNTPKELMILASRDSVNGNTKMLEQIIQSKLEPVQKLEKTKDFGMGR